MDIGTVIKLFQDGDIKLGLHGVNEHTFKNTPHVILSILKKGYYPFTGDFITIISALTGCEQNIIWERARTLKTVFFGQLIKFNSGLFDGLNIRLFKIASDADVFNGMGIPIAVISTNGGATWSGMAFNKYREATMATWIAIYYNALLERIKMNPRAEYFTHDFRYIVVYRPDQKRVDQPKEIGSFSDRLEGFFASDKIFRADNRPIAEIRTELTTSYQQLDAANNVSDATYLFKGRRVGPPPLPPTVKPKTYIQKVGQKSPKRSPRKSPRHDGNESPSKRPRIE